MLARHECRLGDVGEGAGDVTGREHVIGSHNAQAGIDWKPAELVGRHPEVLGKGTGAKPTGPHGRRRRETPSAAQRHSGGRDLDRRFAELKTHAELTECALDEWSSSWADVTSDHRAAADERDGDVPPVLRRSGTVSEPTYQLSCDLDAGKARTDDYGREGVRFVAVTGESLQVLFEASGLGVRVNGEGVFGQAGQRREVDLAAGGKHEPIERQRCELSTHQHGHGVRDHVDHRHPALHTPHPHGAEQAIERDPQLTHVALVKPGPDRQVPVPADQHDLDLVGDGADGAPLLKMAGCAPRAPDACEPPTDYDDPEPPSVLLSLAVHAHSPSLGLLEFTLANIR